MGVDVNGNVTSLTRFEWGATISNNSGLLTGVGGKALQSISRTCNYESSGLTY